MAKILSVCFHIHENGILKITITWNNPYLKVLQNIIIVG